MLDSLKQNWTHNNHDLYVYEIDANGKCSGVSFMHNEYMPPTIFALPHKTDNISFTKNNGVITSRTVITAPRYDWEQPQWLNKLLTSLHRLFSSSWRLNWADISAPGNPLWTYEYNTPGKRLVRLNYYSYLAFNSKDVVNHNVDTNPRSYKYLTSKKVDN